ncbi:catechol 2,3-dioxygenase-like lactoylglutathione lyase family enzyme [Neorhizobium galegae]|uniref:FosX/FosE/FosI family fosfomycin resistance thiol transferase n=1 Tax=Neorhizobium galegae TaxID=399 RepID=UPI001AE82550|nr:FosX/FosE/FosI family fosfomycin resistance thiol transferase [Neorhizobium galegae]MBP2548669.1 catechol 2,3-dioxygenase-like lactoylglutathione lyase family enzyme [Neorhizobium galegae]
MAGGLCHITFVTKNLDRMEKILTTVMKARKVEDPGADEFTLTKERIFQIGEGLSSVWIVLIEGSVDLARSYNHVAFIIREEDVEERLAAIEALGLDLHDGHPHGTGRGLHGEEGHSIYFYDDDNHMFELHVGTLEDRLRRDDRSKGAPLA